jgi:hypothetical protein
MILWFCIALLAIIICGALCALVIAAKMKDSGKLYDWVVVILPATSVLFIWTLGWEVFPKLFGPPENAGTAGDMFGSISSLFSGLAFAGLIATLILQKVELSLQRSELSDTREEFERQRFENRYFSTLRLLNDHVANMRLPADVEGGGDLKGGAVLEYFASELPDELGEDLQPYAHNAIQIEQYLQLYNLLFEPSLGPYFRLMYNCVRQIENSGAPEEDKEAYSKILRAQMSSPEVKLLLFNGVTKWGADFRPWIEKYKLLKHLPSNYQKKNPTLISHFNHLDH